MGQRPTISSSVTLNKERRRCLRNVSEAQEQGWSIVRTQFLLPPPVLKKSNKLAFTVHHRGDGREATTNRAAKPKKKSYAWHNPWDCSIFITILRNDATNGSIWTPTYIDFLQKFHLSILKCQMLPRAQSTGLLSHK